MSKFKRALSVFLAIAMVFGSLSCLGAVVAPKASAAEGTSGVKSYAELAAQYDNFIYFGSEVYEIETADGTLSTAVTSRELTDYYVDAGQLLEERFFIKGDFYFGDCQFIKAYDNSFFDITQVTTKAPDSTGYSTAYTGVVNPENPVVIKNDLTNQLSSADCATENWMTKLSGYTTDELAVIDYVLALISLSGNKADTAYVYDDDVWLFSWVYKVKEGLADGTTGYSKTLPGFWNCDDATAASRNTKWMQRKGTIGIATRPATATEADDNNVFVTDTKTSYVNYDLIDTFLFGDLEHNFTIGANPNAGGTTVKKYTVTFLENDGSEISSTEYVKDAAVAVPPAVEGQIGWANTATGALADLTDYTAVRKAEFKRVLDTDKFEIVLNVDGGEVPEGATVNEDGNIVIEAGFNEEVDLAEVPVPTKEGYTGTWDAETITVDNINGKSANIVWTANKYKATFYLNEGDAEALGTVDATYKANVSYKAEKDGFKFTGWVDAETGAVVSTTDRFAYNFASDKSFYASWTEYDSTVTFMIRDYENGSGWKVASVKGGDTGSTLSKSNIDTILSKIKSENAVDIVEIAFKAAVYSDEALTEYINISDGIKFNGDTTIYVATTITFNVNWVVDGEVAETTKVTTNMTGTTGIYSTYAKTTVDAASAAPGGYTFKGWKNEATGEIAEYTSYGIVLDGSFDREITFVADFQEAEYTLVFNIKNGQFPDELTAQKTFKLGDEINLDGVTFTDKDGKELELPVIGKENSEQPNPFMNVYGYEFKGWKYSKDDAADVTFPVAELTADIIKKYASGEKITINAQWEALEYELRFFYAVPETDMSLDVADRKYADEPIVLKYKTGETIRLTLSGENLEKVIANTPEGYTFYNFRQLEEGTVSKMPAYGLDVYARYTSKSIKVYVDYNNGKTDEDGNLLPLKDTLAETPLTKLYPVYYGDDLERAEDVENNITMGTGTLVMRSIIAEGDMPGDNYEVVAWNTYHVEEGADIYNKENWKPGINDEGSTIAKSTVIYQPEWKHHSEFFFRVYGTDGKIYMALGKDFKLYYWNNNYVCKRGDTTVNKDKENTVILLYKIAFETDGGLTMRLDPIFAPKSMFTWSAIKGLFGALGNLIKGLL